MADNERERALKKALSERILVLDGAMGTAVQALDLAAADFGGPDLEGCNENLVRTRPEAIAQIHDRYLEAGADIVETDTFGGTPLVLQEYGLADRAYEINKLAASIARDTAERHSKRKLRFVAGSMGPTTRAITVTRGVTFEELVGHYRTQAEGLYDGGVDFFLIETCQDTRNAKAGIAALRRIFREGREPIPVALSCTVEANGTMLAGQTVEAFWASVAHLDLLYIGLNCATGPAFMTDHLRSLARLARTPVACVPNAGLPDENGVYLETPEMMGSVLEHFIAQGWVNLIGGCCGTTPSHIERFARLAHDRPPRRPAERRFSFLSGVDFLEVAEENRPVLVGERTNVVGSRKFRKLVQAGDFDAAAEVARGQVRHGAQVIDVCLADPDRDELADMESFLARAARSIRAPVMIDSTDERVIARALTYLQGKGIVNSVNLEEGEKRFERIAPLAAEFGAALVVGTIDEHPAQGMAVTRERKLEIARRSRDLLVRKYGVPPEDLYFDCLVFPCASGDQTYAGSAIETLEGLRLVKEAFPESKTVLGISNVSFGLPEAAREVLNSVFLYHCTRAGLDMAIVNTALLRRYPTLSERERTLAEDLLWNRGADPVGAFAGFFRERKPAAQAPRSALPLDDRLAAHVVEGSKEGLVEDLEEARAGRDPLAIINGPLMKGMDEVGRLFNANELIVAEVLQSAEVMKAAVSYLESFMEKKEAALRGKVLLATVKGDVHDIGKNLVEMVLANNGFEVVNLGIKVPPKRLIDAVRERNPQIVGLSGLLVKSAQQMVTTAEDLSEAGVETPMLVGGAALSRAFVDRRIAKAYRGTVAYASDAMNGLELAKIIVDPERFASLRRELAERRAGMGETSAAGPAAAPPAAARSSVRPTEAPPAPPDFDRHVLTRTPIEEIWSHVNPRMLFGRHLGLPNSAVRLIEEGRRAGPAGSDPEKKAMELLRNVDDVKAICRKENLLRPKAVYRFFRAAARGDEILFFSPSGELLGRTLFPRQPAAPRLCLADYLRPAEGPADSVCVFLTTAGHGVRERAHELKEGGEYLKSHILSALALETAEGFAEWLHAKIRGLWGFPDPPGTPAAELFKARYRGRRYSFGYPACPDLEGQKLIFGLLEPGEIGVELTEACMMDPEASVSALVFHHPEAAYFSV